MELFGSLRIRGIKNHVDATLELQDHLLLVGENGSGKSGIMAGLSFAFTGKVPGYGSDPGALRAIMADGAIAELRPADGETIARQLSYTARKATVETKATSDGEVLDGASAEAAVLKYAGPGSVLGFSFREFLAANGPDRRRIMLDLLPSQSPDEDLIWEQVGALTAVKNLWTPRGGTDEEPVFTLDNAVDLSAWAEEQAGVPVALLPVLHEIILPDLLLSTLHEMSKDSQRDAKAHRQAADKVATIAPEIQELADRLPEIEREHADLLKQTAALEHEAEGQGASELSRLNRERDALIEALASTSPPEVDRHQKALAEIEARIEHHAAQKPEAAGDANVDQGAKLAPIDGLRAGEIARAETLRDRHSAARTGLCPITRRQCPDPEGLAATAEESKAAYLASIATIRKLKEDADAIRAESIRLRTRQKQAMAASETWNGAMDTLHSDRRYKSNTLDEATREAARRLADGKRISVINERIDALPKEEAPDEDYITGLKERLESTTADLEAARQAKASLDLSARIGCDDAIMEASVYKAAWQGARDAHGAFVDDRIGGSKLAFAANLKALGFDGGGFEIGKRAVTIGVRLPAGANVALDGLSDGQAALAALALLGAVPGPDGLNVLLLEAADLSVKSLALGLDFIREHTDFDLAVVASHVKIPGDTEPEDWQVVDLDTADISTPKKEAPDA